MKFEITFYWSYSKFHQLPFGGSNAAERTFGQFCEHLRTRKVHLPVLTNWSCPGQFEDHGEYDVTAEFMSPLTIHELTTLFQRELVAEFADRLEIKEMPAAFLMISSLN